jgi:hypothetical protein
MVYIELLAKENLKVKNYLIEYQLQRQPPSPLRNPSTPRIHDSRSPFTTELLQGHNTVCEEIEAMDDPDNARDTAQFLREHDQGNWLVPMTSREERNQSSPQSI